MLTGKFRRLCMLSRTTESFQKSYGELLKVWYA